MLKLPWNTVYCKLRKVKGWELGVGSLLLLFLLLTPNSSLQPLVYAAISACSASASPSTVKANSSVTISFNITNNDSTNSVNFVRISRPSSRYTVTGGSSGGWSASVSNPDSVTFTGGTISAGSSQSFSLSVDTSPLATGSQSWSIDASDDGGGSTTGCGGAQTSISTDTTAPSISSIASGSITSNSATITWTTDEASNSRVDYGTTVSYGSNTSDGGMVTSHTINLTGLSGGTTYHFKVTSADAVENSASSGDDTFITSGIPVVTPAPSSSPGSSGSDSNSSSSSPGSSNTSGSSAPSSTVGSGDNQPPVVSFSNDLSKPFKTAPTLTGTASDNQGVTKIQYSLDGGKNYLPAVLTTPGGLKTNFSAVLKKLEDGNYDLVARAGDQAGNFGYSKKHLLIIDQLPPLIGSTVFTLGPQILVPSASNKLNILAGLSQKITLSAIGGATKVSLVASPVPDGNGASSSAQIKQFELEKSTDNGLWSAAFNLDEPGVYDLLVQSIDGAGNNFSKVLDQLNVLPDGKVTNGQQVIKDAQILIFYFDQTTQRFIPWDGKSYSQDNPQRTDDQGQYKLLLPPGKYYLQVQAAGFKTIKSSIFNLDQFTPITQDFNLSKKLGLNLGKFDLSWPDFSQQTVSINLQSENQTEVVNSLIGQRLDFVLTSGGQTLNSVFLEGKPTVVAVLNSWMPQTTQQLENLQSLDKNEFQAVAIFPLESASFIDSYKKVGGYQIPIYADPLGNLSQKINLPYSPANLFLERSGVVRAIRYGLLSSEEMMGDLIN